MHSLKKRTLTFGLKESIKLSCLLIGGTCRAVKLPGDRPGASHRPEELCLNYKLGTHLSVTQNSQWYNTGRDKHDVNSKKRHMYYICIMGMKQVGHNTFELLNSFICIKLIKNSCFFLIS